MADRLSPEARSRNMGAIKGADTRPELAVRRMLHAAGFRFRLHRKDLPGRPDIVFPSRRKAIFVHGCFWHRHPGCPYAYVPKTRVAFWQEKFQRNTERDAKAQAALAACGWRSFVVWECELPKANLLMIRLRAFLGDKWRAGTEKPRRRQRPLPARSPA
jgi:DNA mismatch endonuclease (patch repair protein)